MAIESVNTNGFSNITMKYKNSILLKPYIYLFLKKYIITNLSYQSYLEIDFLGNSIADICSESIQVDSWFRGQCFRGGLGNDGAE